MTPTPVRVLSNPDRAQLVLHPLRRRILEAAAQTPASASDLGAELGESRQKINHHLRVLRDVGLLELARSERRRGLTENYYQATAEAYLVSPRVLGALAPDPNRERDRFSAAHLLALTARTQTELGDVLEAAAAEEKRVPTLALDATLHFTDPGQRKAFTEALHETVLRLVETHSVPAATPGARAYRLIVGAHPKPKEESARDE